VAGETPIEPEEVMANTTEHAQPPAVVRVIELVGVSSKSWSDAAQQAVARASQTIRHITGVDVVNSSAIVKDGKITEYHVNVKLAFVIEKGGVENP
jgi:flavin-binding protein dodecin